MSLRAVLSILCLSSLLGALHAQDPNPGASAGASSSPSPSAADDLEVADLLPELGAALRWDPLSGIGALETPAHRTVFRAAAAPGSAGRAIMDGVRLLDGPVPYLSGGELRFPRAFVASLKTAFGPPADTPRSRFRVAAILVDPGHGGKDSGAVGRHVIDGKKVELKEKDVVLDVAAGVYDQLVQAYPDKRILMTRKGDTYPTLEQRVAQANSVPLADDEAILFVSVHANASFNKEARGYEVWYLSPEYRRTVINAQRRPAAAEVLPILNAMLEEEFTTESLLIARSIMEGYARSIGKLSPPRGIKAEEWFVVRNARMPSVLVEVGFVTNPEDAALLIDPLYLRKQSDAIYSGIKDFITKFERTGGFTASR